MLTRRHCSLAIVTVSVVCLKIGVAARTSGRWGMRFLMSMA